MKKIIISLLLIVVGFVSSSHTAPLVYGSCLAQSIQEHRDQADIIVAGKVSAVDDSLATIQVDRYFKGHGGPSTIVLEKGPDITSVDLFLEEGKDYLLFLRIDNNTYKTDLCMGSREMTDGLTTEEADVLGSGEKTIPQQPGFIAQEMEKPVIIRNINMFLIAIMAFGGAVLWVYFYRYPRKKKKK